MLIILEDAHCIDATTLELFERIAAGITSRTVLALVTARSEFEHEFASPNVSRLALHRLGRQATGKLIARLAGAKRLPREVVDQIRLRADGVPLFAEELTKTVLDSGFIREIDNAVVRDRSLPTIRIPETLHDALTARLDRLATAKEVAQTAACIGREFDEGLLMLVSLLSQPEIRLFLDQLVSAGIVLPRGRSPKGTYSFTHALLRDVAYGSLRKSRRTEIHGRILDGLASPARGTPPEVIAHHATEAGAVKVASEQWLEAGRVAAGRWAPREAVSHLNRALGLIALLPNGLDRDRLELDVQALLGPMLVATSGYSADITGRAYERAGVLCRSAGEAMRLGEALFGQFLFNLVRGNLIDAQGIASEMLGVGLQRGDPDIEAMGHRALGTTGFFLGAFSTALDHLNQALQLIRSEAARPSVAQYVFDPLVSILVFLSLALLPRGFEKQAIACNAEARRRASELGHPATTAFEHHHGCFFEMMRGDIAAVHNRAEYMIHLAREEELPVWLATGLIYLGWALALRGETRKGIATLTEGVTRWRFTGARLWLPCYLSLLSDAIDMEDRPEEAIALLNEAVALSLSTSDRHYLAEVQRRRSRILLRTGDGGPGEAVLKSAIDTARDQNANLWELRSAIALARLWSEEGRREKARDLLAPIYNQLTEGFATQDLETARTLLEALT